jgi:ABC-2 type transport system ATP-binding protein
MADEFAVRVKGLSKTYGDTVALDGIDLEVRRGEIFGVLGSNGAGKTTLIETLEGLREPDAGEVSVLGFDPNRDLNSIKESIGIQLQATSFYRKLTVFEVLKQFSSYYSRKTDLEELLTKVSLNEKRDSYTGNLSGGQRQRLALALALVSDPEILFLDEPTTGLDASIRRQLWHTIGQLRQDGKTVMLTTHYIEEAERLCDRVLIIEGGKAVALDTPSNLISQARGGGARIRLITKRPLDLKRVQGIRTIEAALNASAHYVLQANDTGPVLMNLIRCIEEQNNELVELQMTRRSLEDVFVGLIGKGIE